MIELHPKTACSHLNSVNRVESVMGELQSASGQALVLGGGGVAGIAWMTGLLLGLSEKGVNLRATSDTLIGTSAGSTVAAQIAGETSLDDLFQRQVDPTRQVAELAPKPHLLELAASAFLVLVKLSDPVERTRRIGDLALKTTTVPESVRREVIAARLPTHTWPTKDLRIVAVDVATGEPRIFDRLSEVDLVDAVAASCAVPGMWPPVTIGINRYMDGGIRSSDNADLAAGRATIIVVSPLGARGMSMPGSDLSSQVAGLQQGGARVRIVEPNDAAREAIGHNPLSPDTRRPAAEAGRVQGWTIAADIANFIKAHVTVDV